ncbi:MAG: Uncharacterised protein [Cryomorphaceae bacterium]|nr:MAG: Uncharacterised protein [Cryomorphaceae bacterium]
MSIAKALQILGLTLLISSCQRTTIYDVGTQTPNIPGQKNELKDDLQFMTIAYRDLYEEEIPVSVLETMRKAYISFGDKALVVDEIVQSLLLNPDLELPTQQEIADDPGAFISQTYKRFFLRDASDFELAFWESQLAEDESLTAQDIYYVFMTSSEYKYY